jgi:hypothetical protein
MLAEDTRVDNVYYMADRGLIKIGRADDILSRLMSHRTSNPFARIIGITRNYSELQVHCKFASLRQHGEWFTHSTEIEAFIEDNMTLEDVVLVHTIRSKFHTCESDAATVPARLSVSTLDREIESKCRCITNLIELNSRVGGVHLHYKIKNEKLLLERQLESLTTQLKNMQRVVQLYETTELKRYMDYVIKSDPRRFERFLNNCVLWGYIPDPNYYKEDWYSAVVDSNYEVGYTKSTPARIII